MLVITSSGFYNSEVLNLLVQRTTTTSSIGIITAGIADKSARDLTFTEYKNRIMQVSTRNIVEIDTCKLATEALLKQDCLVILGGNSRLLFDSIRKPEVSEILRSMSARQDCTVITVSAASMLFSGGNIHCRWLDPILNIDQGFYPDFNHSGFNFVPDLILPHVEKFYEMNKNLEAEILKIEQAKGISIRRMKRMEYIVV